MTQRSARFAALALARRLRRVGGLRRGPPASPYARAIEQSRAMLDQVLQLYPGTAVAVAVGDDIVWSTAFGFADVDRQRPVSRSTQFRIYEVAMPLTATVMARLAQEGPLRPRRAHPEVPARTCRRRGIPGHGPLARRATWPGARRLPARASIAAAPCSGRPRGRPRRCPAASSSARRASDTRCRARATCSSRPPSSRPPGSRFSELLNEIDRLARRDELDDGRRSAALPARPDALLRARLVRPAAHGPPGRHELPLGRRRLLSTTDDLVRFGAALLRGEILRGDTLEAMFTPQKTRNGVGHRLRPRLARRDGRPRPPLRLARRPRRGRPERPS